MGRLRRNVSSILFLCHISHCRACGQAVDRGENGAFRDLFRFVAAMIAIRSLRIEEYVPGLP